MEQEKTFGQWLRAWRLEQGLTLQDLEMRVGMKNGSLSRIENDLHQVTIGTVTRICEGLGMTPDDLLSVLGRRREPASSELVEGLQYERNVLTPDDGMAFLRFFMDNPEAGRDILAYLSSIMSHILLLKMERVRAHQEEKEEPSTKPRFTLQPLETNTVLINLLLSEYPGFRTPDLEYPTLDITAIIEIYKQGGLIIEDDISWYIFRRKSKLPSTMKLDRRYDYVQNSLEARSAERCKLADVLWLDETFEMAGQLLSMFWDVSKFKQEIAKNYGKSVTNWSDDVIAILIKIWRWLHFLGEPMSYWLDDLRRKVTGSKVL